MLFAMHKHRSVIDSKTNKRVEFLLKGLCFRHEVVVKQECFRDLQMFTVRTCGLNQQSHHKSRKHSLTGNFLRQTFLRPSFESCGD